MLVLQKNWALVRTTVETGDPELDSMIGYVLGIIEVTEEDVITYIMRPFQMAGRITLVNDPEALEGIFESRQPWFQEAPEDLPIEQGDWLILCSLLGGESTAAMAAVSRMIEKTTLGSGKLSEMVRPEEITVKPEVWDLLRELLERLGPEIGADTVDAIRRGIIERRMNRLASSLVLHMAPTVPKEA